MFQNKQGKNKDKPHKGVRTGYGITLAGREAMEKFAAENPEKVAAWHKEYQENGDPSNEK